MKEAKMSKKEGFFIVLEGLDGAGTTTQTDEISKYLEAKKIKAHITREPTDSMVGGLIRSLLKKHWQATSEVTQLLFAADRGIHLEKEIVPILNKGVNVITDRYYFSSIAYGSVDIEDKNWIKGINSRFRDPDLVIYVRVEASEALERIEKGRYNEMELFEKKEALSKVVVAYDELAKKLDYFVTVDGSKSKEEVAEDIIAVLKDKLNLG